MKLKALSVVQVADAKGQVKEHKPGSVFNVGKEDGERLIASRHAEKAVDDVEEQAPATNTSSKSSQGNDQKPGDGKGGAA